ncbi:hypothetical protein FNH05_01575 [Amycolatopsis rhizosphaerae]|uniref:Uncharacterized protein n=1 Tax=Amycolatopsis rhizosphaerae TaxID=2053003 RepID=A0A558DME6_9PSEU|nr:hypothetical protein [Amycolatopsis rhizosphaerae]TVT62187.1 hypothetical protein FNH05_01575 [Amycolatopsis rhizosphaerae]
MAINDPSADTTSAVLTAGGFGGVAAAINFVNEAVQAGMNEKAMEQAKQAAKGLGDAATAGQIRITPEGFDILMKTLDQCDDHLRDLQFNVHAVVQAPQLGSSPYAQTVAAHVQKGGAGPDQSAEMMVRQLGPVFDAIRDALNKAKQAYEDNEHANLRKLK